MHLQTLQEQAKSRNLSIYIHPRLVTFSNRAERRQWSDAFGSDFERHATYNEFRKAHKDEANIAFALFSTIEPNWLEGSDWRAGIPVHYFLDL
jgi:hypothetical protein